MMKKSRSLKMPMTQGWLLFIVMALSALIVWGCADKKDSIYKVGILCGADFFIPVIEGFKTEMAALGYVEGVNIIYDVRLHNADPVGERRTAEKLVSNRVDLIVSIPTEASVAAQAAVRGSGIPLVFCYAGLEGTDLVDSVRRPGRNTTGLRFPGPETISKRLEYLIRIAPSAKRVWIGYNKHYPNTAPALTTLRQMAMSEAITLVELPADTLADIEDDLSQRLQRENSDVDAVILMPDTFNHSPAGWNLIRNFAQKSNVPIGGSFLYTVEQGALFGNANDLAVVGKLTAPLAAKVLRGVPAGDIPVVTPEQQLIVNYQTAQKLGLSVPEGLLNMATRIIQ